MSEQRVSAQNPFPKLAQVREALRERAGEIIEMYMKVVVEANEAGDHKTAAKSLQWLMEHMPADEAGTKLVDSSVDKQPKQDRGYGGPRINIGFQLGGVTETKALPQVSVVEVPAPSEKVDDE